MTLQAGTRAREEALRRAVEAVQRDDERTTREGPGFRWDRMAAVDVLEEALGPLDWYSFQGEGYRLLREVAEEVFGPDYGRGRAA